MEPRILLTGIIGGVITLLAWHFVEFSAAGIVAIITITIVISMAISADAARHLHPEIFASLADDAQTVMVENLGTASATGVQVRIIPDDIRYEVGTLAIDAHHQYELPSMIRNAKAAVSWEKSDGTRKEKIFRLSGYTEETDPLRPVFPLFGWREK